MYDGKDSIMYGYSGALRLFTKNKVKTASDHRQLEFGETSIVSKLTCSVSRHASAISQIDSTMPMLDQFIETCSNIMIKMRAVNRTVAATYTSPRGHSREKCHPATHNTPVSLLLRTRISLILAHLNQVPQR